MKTSVFISYAREDAARVREIVEVLRGALDADIWIDDRIPGGANFIEVLEREILQRNYLVFMASPHAFQSSWCKREVNLALTQQKPIVPVFLEECEAPQGKGFAFATSASNYILSYRLTNEELAASFRDSILSQAAAAIPRQPIKTREEMERFFQDVEEMLDEEQFDAVTALIGTPEENPLFRRASDEQLAKIYMYLLWAERQIRWSKSLSSALLRPFSGHSYSCACRYGMQEELSRINSRLCENIKAFVNMQVDLEDEYSYSETQLERCGGDWYYLWQCFLYQTANLNAEGPWKRNKEIEALRRWYTAFEQLCPAWLLKGGPSWSGIRASGRVKDYFERLETLAAQHNGSAEYEKGMVLRWESSGAEQAAEYLRQAADKGHAEAQYELGLCYAYGEGVATDLKMAAQLFFQAADQGLIEAQREYARCCKFGEGVAPDGEKALYWYCRAGDQGDVWAQYKAGICYDDGEGVEENKQEAIKWFRKAAENESAQAKYRLARFYDYGWGVEINKPEAARLYREAAVMQLPEAQNALGVALSFGDGVPEDKAAGAEWYRRAAEQGLANAQYNLAMCYDHGNGVAEDKAEAARLYRLAAAQGDEDAMYNLGVALLRGTGVERNTSEAMDYLRRAAESGSGRAANFLRHSRRSHSAEEAAQ